ncbi:hypothetical protein JL720_6476 [Aureococcus anophagefferens]|nr:hypothetical protein JL720_6476 [Aureococcus anophagefferens]
MRLAFPRLPRGAVLLLLPVVGGEPCVSWSSTERTLFVDEHEPAGEAPYCRRTACGDATCAEECLVASPRCDVWWRYVSADVIPPIPELAVRLPGDGGRGAAAAAPTPGSAGAVLDEWRRDGVILRDFDAIGGDAGLRDLLAVVAGEPGAAVPAPPYAWVARNVSATAGDPQSAAHIDSFASVVKVWLFDAPLTPAHGPLTVAVGSQRHTVDRLAWLHAYATGGDEARREPSFRLRGSPAAAARARVRNTPGMAANVAYGAPAKKAKVDGKVSPQTEEAPKTVSVVGPYGLLTSKTRGHLGCDAAKLREARIDMAACYRIMDELGLNEGIDNHLTVMVPGTRDRFLCIPYGLNWSEVTASNLLLLDANGDVVEGDGLPDPTAFYIHSRIHLKHPHAVCVLHTHQPKASALCCLEDMEIKMIHQNSCRFLDEVAYDTVTRASCSARPGDRLAEVMGSKRVLMHQSHGPITCGDSVAEAFDEIYYLERACEVQLLAMNTGKPTVTIKDSVARFYKDQVDQFRGCWAQGHFEARKRALYKPKGLGNADFAS